MVVNTVARDAPSARRVPRPRTDHEKKSAVPRKLVTFRGRASAHADNATANHFNVLSGYGGSL